MIATLPTMILVFAHDIKVSELIISHRLRRCGDADEPPRRFRSQGNSGLFYDLDGGVRRYPEETQRIASNFNAPIVALPFGYLSDDRRETELHLIIQM